MCWRIGDNPKFMGIKRRITKKVWFWCTSNKNFDFKLILKKHCVLLCLIDHWEWLFSKSWMYTLFACIYPPNTNHMLYCTAKIPYINGLFFPGPGWNPRFFGDSFVIVAEVDFNLDVPFRIILERSNESEYRRPILQPVVEPSGKVSVGWFKGKSEP